ncbi:hypothetical protein Pint_30034 [Pistacia integerrima]|uniref:Uncharacterized protein n=1 Tax=Pistacia integerrima TaxID=434235 RepID=A0ACC0WYK7_9ROSI|nr:hypothetical protein Pint_30034 [Pistacia integerrima]
MSLMTSFWEQNPNANFSFLPDHYQAELEKFNAEASGGDAFIKEVAKVASSPEDTPAPSP